MWCCGKVDVIEPVKTDTLKVDVAIAAKPIVLVSRADIENQIVVVKKEVEDVDAAAANAADAAEEELTTQTITALLGIALMFGVTYLAFNAKVDESFYIDAPHDL